MTTEKYPISGPKRRDRAKARRHAAATLNTSLEGYQTANNGDNVRFDDTYVMAFTKGLDHDWGTGFAKSVDVHAFESALTQPGPNGSETQRKFMIPQSGTSYVAPADEFRVWESPLSGMAYENEGPDPDAVSMAPAPKLGETELCAEMLEVYAMALVRDMPFSELAQAGNTLKYHPVGGKALVPFAKGGADALVSDLIDALNTQNWFKTPGHVTTTLGEDGSITMLEQSRQSARGEPGAPSAAVTTRTLFRGSSSGCQDGPYISQFLLQGAGRQGPGGKVRDKAQGEVSFGAQSISQKVSANTPGADWMTTWPAWLSVQNGVAVGGRDIADNKQRFISTPRDLATYVHIDQLYQAYFVACLMLLEEFGQGDAGFPEPNATGTRAPFATFGGPHVLSLMTEVASRGLRAVRRQKFQVHRRARPERLAAMITVAKGHADGTKVFGDAEKAMTSILKELGLIGSERPVTQIMSWINALNTDRNSTDPYEPGEELPKDPPPVADGHNYLLPMAFPEGSPMHPAYGAGHATVAGACTTVLKAFFNIYDVTPMPSPHAHGTIPSLTPKMMPEIGFENVYQGDAATGHLDHIKGAAPLTVEGELNKLAANIAIGRNFAGVHYYTDYYDSVRMGERVAVGILREHLISHPEYVAMHLRGFDGDTIRISTKGDGQADLEIWDKHGSMVPEQAWWERDVAEFTERPLAPSDAADLLVAGAGVQDSNWDA